MNVQADHSKSALVTRANTISASWLKVKVSLTLELNLYKQKTRWTNVVMIFYSYIPAVRLMTDP